MNSSSEPCTTNLMLGRHYHITGIVQGVGFRPFVFQTAVKLNLKGNVCNSADGVLINIFGPKDSLDLFHEVLQTTPPPRARIDFLEYGEIPFLNEKEFRILPSQDIESEFLPVSPDISICEACRKEILDTRDRRYHYPFTNCTNCGPRFSIIEKIPYDRPNTSMKSFPMCQSCADEYENPLDRRFHAQPVACRSCGPQLTFLKNSSDRIFTRTAAMRARISRPLPAFPSPWRGKPRPAPICPPWATWPSAWRIFGATNPFRTSSCWAAWPRSSPLSSSYTIAG